jgi:hypothetical protein
MIKERLVEEMKKAMKEKDFTRLDTIRLVLAEIKNTFGLIWPYNYYELFCFLKIER